MSEQTYTIERVTEMSEGQFKGPMRFYDGRNGWARQDFVSMDEPRFGYAWQRENRKDKGRTYYLVDGAEVSDLEEATRLLSLPPDPESPDERMRLDFEDRGPKLGPCYRAKWEAPCNADVGAFAMVRAAMRRVDNAWHVGINRHSDAEREAGRPSPNALYSGKHAAHESYRLMYLWRADRAKDTGLQCQLGVRCRDCPILSSIDKACEEDRTREKFGHPDMEDDDIDMAKTWTCITHMLQEMPGGYFGGGMLTTEADRNDTGWF